MSLNIGIVMEYSEPQDQSTVKGQMTQSPRALHTQGPWHVNRYRACIQTRSPAQQNDVANTPICYTAVGHGMPETTDGDANLIAAAPDLLEALSLLFDFQNGCPLPSYEENWERAMKLSLAALTKAGERSSVPAGNVSSNATRASTNE